VRYIGQSIDSYFRMMILFSIFSEVKFKLRYFSLHFVVAVMKALIKYSNGHFLNSLNFEAFVLPLRSETIVGIPAHMLKRD
jgi:hypothetical protein